MDGAGITKSGRQEALDDEFKEAFDIGLTVEDGIEERVAMVKRVNDI